MTALQDTAASIVDSVAGRIEAPARVASLTLGSIDGGPETATTPPWNIAGGLLGGALLFAELGQDSSEHRRTLHAYLDFAARFGARADAAKGLLRGPAGLAFVAESAARSSTDYARLRADLDPLVQRAVESKIEARTRARGPGHASFAGYDVVTGLTGLGRYLLLRGPSQRSTLDQLLTHLIDFTHPRVVEGVELPGWWVDHAPFADPTGYDGRGHANLGMAHGICGPLALLSVAWLRGVRLPGHASAICRIMDWLLRWRAVDEDGSYWPEYVSMDVERGQKPSVARPRAAWCYGQLGMARALQLAACAMDRPDWTALAVDSARGTLMRPEADLAVVGPGLCHGWAGLLHITGRIAADTRDPALNHGVERLAERVIALFDRSTPFGFETPGVTRGRPRSSTGLLEGAAGIALALQAFARGKVVTSWDSALLLA
ncbi:MAG: lantibiotic biosynthesis protein [Kribbellaceae bacterium]|nr:lantibiotic biosynthesis protein [Kribbellaceae bacterium]